MASGSIEIACFRIYKKQIHLSFDFENKVPM